MLAKAIFVSGAPFVMVEHPVWKEFFKRLRPSYELPSRKHISTTLLDFHYNQTKKMVDNEVKNANVLHLQLDGWSNIRNESIINFVVNQPKPYFVDFVATEEKSHTGQYLAAKIKEVIEQYGSDKFFSCIGDNARNMQAGLRISTENFPHIQTFGCKAHTLNLLCSDILHLSSSKKVFGNAKKIIKKIKKSHRLYSVFTQKQSEKEIQTALKLPPETRWGYSTQCLDSLIKNKGVLRMMAADPDMKNDFDQVNVIADEDDDDENETEPELPGEVKKLILDDQFWLKVESLFEILQPISECITTIETDDLIVHKSHEIFTKMFSAVEALVKSSLSFDARDKKNAEKCVRDRKDQIIHPIMLAAAILDPATMGVHLTTEEAMDGVGFIFDAARKVKLDEQAVMTQLTNYRAKDDMWKKEFVWISCGKVKPLVWWKSFFGHTELMKIAERILTTPLTSAATERTFSTFSNVHTKKRNRLTTERSGKITYIAHNHKLMHGNDKEAEPAAKRLRLDEADSDDEEL